MDEITRYWEEKERLDADGCWAPPGWESWDIGELLRRRRGLDFTSQRALAARSGVDHAEISRVEAGRDSRLSTLRRLAAALDCELVVRLRPRPAPR